MHAHPYAELFPMMPEAELQELADDIKQHGLRLPVTTYEGKILDGRNRYAACQVAGILPVPSVEFEGDDSTALTFVISSNLHRRQLSTSQRAMIAARIANLAVGSNQHKAKVTHNNATGEKYDPPLEVDRASANLRSHKPSASKLSEKLAVSERTIETAREVIEHGTPELIKAVESGEVKASAAAEVAKLPKAEQKKIVKAGPDAVKKKAADIRKASKPTTPEPVIAPEPEQTETVPANTTGQEAAPEAFVKSVEELCRDMDKIKARIVGLRSSPFSFCLHLDSAAAQVEAARKTLWVGRPIHECPYCKANEEVRPNCNACQGTNRVKVTTYQSGIKAVGGVL